MWLIALIVTFDLAPAAGAEAGAVVAPAAAAAGLVAAPAAGAVVAAADGAELPAAAGAVVGAAAAGFAVGAGVGAAACPQAASSTPRPPTARNRRRVTRMGPPPQRQ